jgi:hypothetical protein
VTPVQGGDGALRYEIHRIWGHLPQGQLPARVTLRDAKTGIKDRYEPGM